MFNGKIHENPLFLWSMASIAMFDYRRVFIGMMDLPGVIKHGDLGLGNPRSNYMGNSPIGPRYQ